MKAPLRRVRNILLAVVLIFAASFAGADYYLRGHLYYTKRAANFLVRNTWQALFPPTGPVRLYVRVEADQDYRSNHPDWRNRLPGLMDAVSARFAEEFDIHLTILAVGGWDRPEELQDYSAILIYAEKKIDMRSAQILVLMTGKDEESGRPDRWVDVGVAHYMGNCVIVGEDFQLLHELGHLFGAVDYPPGSPGFASESIYSYKYADRTDRIDPANHDRIMRNKHRLLW
jgi:hypothetical protein